MHLFTLVFLVASLFVCTINPSVALYVPMSVPFGGGMVNAFGRGNNIQAVWGPDGYFSTSSGPGFASQMQGHFGPNSGSISNSISRVQVFPPLAAGVVPVV